MSSQLLGMSARQLVLRTIPEDSYGMEVGVHRGDFAAELLSVSKPRKLHLVDPWMYREDATYKRALYGQDGAPHGQSTLDTRYEYVQERFAAAIAAGQVVVHRGTSAEVLGAFPDASLDWVYIDGDHTEAAVTEDLNLAWRKVRKGGFIFGDDYGLKGRGWHGDGVTKALHKFLAGTEAMLWFLHDAQFAVRRT